MRRSDRQIKDFDDIVKVLSRCQTIRLGLNGEEYPYVVPLSFGFEVEDGRIRIYFHGASAGLKHDLIKRCPKVCVEADTMFNYATLPDGVTTEYESVIGFGTAELVADDEAEKGLELLLSHCGYEGYRFNKETAKHTAVYRVTLDSVTGKRRRV